MMFNKKIIVALCITLLASMGISLPYPVLTPLFIGTEASSLNQFAGLSPEVLFTLIISIYPLGIFIGSSFIGALSDRFGRKQVLIQTLIICFIGYLVSAYALIEEDYLLLLVSRFLTGITEGNVAIARAIALDIGADPELGEKTDAEVTQAKTSAISLINSSVFLGWLLGPLIGGILADSASHYAMFAAAFGAVLCIVMVKYFLVETRAELPKSEMSVWQSVIKENSFQLLKNIWVRKLFYAYFVYTFAINLYYEFYPVWLVDKHQYGSMDIGFATTNMTIFMTLASIFLVTRLQSRYGLVQPMKVAMMCLVVSLLILPSTTTISTHVVFACSGIFIAVFNGMLPVYISDNEPNSGNGATMGLLTMTFCLSNVFAAIVGGGLLMFNSVLPLYSSAVLFLLAIVLFEVWLFSTKSNEPFGSKVL